MTASSNATDRPTPRAARDVRVEEAVGEDSIKLTDYSLPGINGSGPRAACALVCRECLCLKKIVPVRVRLFYTKAGRLTLVGCFASGRERFDDSACFSAAVPMELGVRQIERRLKLKVCHGHTRQRPNLIGYGKGQLLDFNHASDDRVARQRQRKRLARRQSWRIWTLLLALGMVVLAMRQLNQPTTAQRLGQLFGAQDLSDDDADGTSVEFTPTTDAVPTAAVDEVQRDAEPIATNRSSNNEVEPLSKIRDNTYFRPDETEAWFDMFEALQNRDDTALMAASIGELTYAQLLKQPDYYRGKVVTVRGTIRREELQQAPDNRLNIETYHRLWIEPVGGGNWLIVVYCLALPNDFPRGDQLSESVAVTGHFFKNWSYTWDGGLAIAPAVLARSVDWQPAASLRPLTTAPSQRSWLQAIIIATLFAAIVVYVALRTTRRPSRMISGARDVQLPGVETPTESVREQLRQLAKGDSQS